MLAPKFGVYSKFTFIGLTLHYVIDMSQHIFESKKAALKQTNIVKKHLKLTIIVKQLFKNLQVLKKTVSFCLLIVCRLSNYNYILFSLVFLWKDLFQTNIISLHGDYKPDRPQAIFA
jgi:hypothetical protein